METKNLTKNNNFPFAIYNSELHMSARFQSLLRSKRGDLFYLQGHKIDDHLKLILIQIHL